MPSLFYGIVELENGDIALEQMHQKKGKPVITIQLASDFIEFVGSDKFEIAKAMIEAGLKIIAEAGNEEIDHEIIDLKNNSPSLH